MGPERASSGARASFFASYGFSYSLAPNCSDRVSTHRSLNLKSYIRVVRSHIVPSASAPRDFMALCHLTRGPRICPSGGSQKVYFHSATYFRQVLPARFNRGSTCTRLFGAAAAAATTMSLTTSTFLLDSFAQRQWDDPNYGGTRVSYDKAEFVRRIQEACDQGSPLVDGYAPFCKHLFVPNFVGARLGALAVTEANRGKLQSGYTKRRPEELAVLTRWFCSADVEVPEAKYLDIILYSREQLEKEYAAMPSKAAAAAGGGEQQQALPDAPWGIISIKAQDEPFETPMQPITMLRNALGREEGGSGVPLDRAAYEKSVAYWECHATIVEGARPNGE